jgi:hypothetical protein
MLGKSGVKEIEDLNKKFGLREFLLVKDMVGERRKFSPPSLSEIFSTSEPPTSGMDGRTKIRQDRANGCVYPNAGFRHKEKGARSSLHLLRAPWNL